MTLSLSFCGVENKYIYTDGTTEEMGGGLKTAFVDTSSDGSLIFQDYAEKPIIYNFTRGTAVGGTGTASFKCYTGMFSGCDSVDSISLKSELIAIQAIE